MNTFVQLTVGGLTNGAILSLAAVGFALIYKASGVINFAQGEFLLVGAYAVYAGIAIFGFHWSIAVGLAFSLAVVLAVLIERFVLRPMIGESIISVIMVTIGISSILQGIVQLVFGTSPRRMPPFLPSGSFIVFGISVSASRLTAIALAAVVLGIVGWFFTRTRHGVAMRAVADDAQAAQAVGIGVQRVVMTAWALAGASAVVGGILVANLVGASAGVAAFGLIVFPVVILGGLDSILGTLIGGLVIGLLVQYTGGYLGGGLQQVVPYLLLVLILMIRPYGLFGTVKVERV